MRDDNNMFNMVKTVLLIVVVIIAVGLTSFNSGESGSQSTEETTEDIKLIYSTGITTAEATTEIKIEGTTAEETTEIKIEGTETDTEEIGTEETGLDGNSEDDETDTEETGVDETSNDDKDLSNKEVLCKDADDVFLLGNNLVKNAYIEKIMADMTTEEKISQMFFLCVKDRFDESLLEKFPVGGILLFGNDVTGENRTTFTQKISDFQDASEIPLLVGIDEEGGTVSRLNTNSKLVDYTFESPQTLYAEGGFDAISEDTVNKCALLKSYGINVNFAPVCDIATSKSDYMYSRSFGGDAESTSQYVSLMVETMTENGIGSVLKHFPGYGNNGDTHTDVVRDKRSYETFVENDFLPFEAGIESGAECVLVSHNIVECVDSEKPASLSSKMHDILRDDLGFDGVIITDDLSMDGISDYIENDEAAVTAIQAGNDMIISTYYQDQYDAVYNAVVNQRISIERIDSSVRRILGWKYDLGLLQDSLQ